MPRPWSPGPPDPGLGKGAVHVWRADLEAVDDELGRLLCEEERARAERLLSRGARRRWARGRGVLRALLARYLGLDPRALEFSLGEHGKPMLETGGARPLQFNLSHSGELALYAVSDAGTVGIDVERSRRRTGELGIAARVLGDAEAKRLRMLDPEARTREFLRAWVARGGGQVPGSRARPPVGGATCARAVDGRARRGPAGSCSRRRRWQALGARPVGVVRLNDWERPSAG